MKIIRRFPEDRKLIKVTILHDGSNAWTLQWKGGVKVVRGEREDLVRVLKRIKAKDNQGVPRSNRVLRYSDIVDEVTDGTDLTVWVWEKDLKTL